MHRKWRKICTTYHTTVDFKTAWASMEWGYKETLKTEKYFLCYGQDVQIILLQESISNKNGVGHTPHTPATSRQAPQLNNKKHSKQHSKHKQSRN